MASWRGVRTEEDAAHGSRAKLHGCQRRTVSPANRHEAARLLRLRQQRSSLVGSLCERRRRVPGPRHAEEGHLGEQARGVAPRWQRRDEVRSDDEGEGDGATAARSSSSSERGKARHEDIRGDGGRFPALQGHDEGGGGGAEGRLDSKGCHGRAVAAGRVEGGLVGPRATGDEPNLRGAGAQGRGVQWGHVGGGLLSTSSRAEALTSSAARAASTSATI